MDKIKVVDGCWIWQNCKQSDGYGSIRCGDKTWLAHRLIWTFENGKIPDGMEICHTCDNPACVNPKHLWAGTRADNNHDMMEKGRFIPKYKNGSKNCNAKLSEKDVIEIRKKSLNGYKLKELSKIYNVSYDTIRLISKRITWKHI